MPRPQTKPQARKRVNRIKRAAIKRAVKKLTPAERKAAIKILQKRKKAKEIKEGNKNIKGPKGKVTRQYST